MVYIHTKKYILSVDEATGYAHLEELKRGAENDEIAHACERIILSYLANRHVPREICSDDAYHGIEHLLIQYRVKHVRSIPYEHERIAERMMGTIRRRMITKIVELKYSLGNAFYLYLALDVIRKLNMTPNVHTLPLIPQEIIEGRRVNYAQDLQYNFGSPVLCPSYGAGVSADIGICLGIPAHYKGGILVWIPGHQQPMVRRGIKAMPLTEQLKELLNRMFNGDTTYATLFHYKSRPPDTDATLILPPTPFPDVGAPYTALGTAPPPTLPLAAPPAAPPTPTIPPVDTEIVVASGGYTGQRPTKPTKGEQTAA